jgi:dTDP-4-dehydrorhamnose reductase
MKILLLGNKGQLGWELHRALSTLGIVIALDFPQIDLAKSGAKSDSLVQTIQATRPQVIVNATAYTAVDRAESEPEIAHAVNAIAPGFLAGQAHQIGAALIHYSTDYVFDGLKGCSYVEEDSQTPLNIYGKSKLAGEQAIIKENDNYLILRTSWVYSLRRDSFVTKVLQWARQRSTLQVVSDQIGSPTWARSLAEITAQLLAMGSKDIYDWVGERRGLYHLAGSGFASRLEWAKAILELDPRREEQTAQEIRPALTTDFPTPARRPLYSALNCDKFTDTFGISLPDWRDALQLAMEI